MAMVRQRTPQEEIIPPTVVVTIPEMAMVLEEAPAVEMVAEEEEEAEVAAVEAEQDLNVDRRERVVPATSRIVAVPTVPVLRTPHPECRWISIRLIRAILNRRWESEVAVGKHREVVPVAVEPEAKTTPDSRIIAAARARRVTPDRVRRRNERQVGDKPGKHERTLPRQRKPSIRMSRRIVYVIR